MKILKRIGQLFSVVAVGVGVAACFFPPLWPVAVSFVGVALLSWGAYGLVRRFRSSVEPPVRSPIPSPSLSPIHPSNREMRIKELRQRIEELKEELKEKDKKLDMQIAALKSKNEILEERLAALKSKNESIKERLAAIDNKAKPPRRHSFPSISLSSLFKPLRRFSFEGTLPAVARADNGNSVNSIPRVTLRSPR